MKTLAQTALLVLFFGRVSLGDSAHLDRSAIPVIGSAWWQIAGDPDLGEFTSPEQQPVDFGVWQAADGTWQLWSCIRHTQYGGNTRLFYRWEGRTLTDRNWKGIAMTADTSLGESKGGLQAPYVVKENGVYYMFYGDWQRICLATSRDGKTFTRWQNEQGQPALFSGPYGNTRDPKVHYDAGKILFAWRKQGLPNYNLYEMNTDGSGIRQVTSGPYDDYEPEYLPDGGIVFVSTRARRWVGCWKTRVGTLHRCNGDGSGIQMLSCNIEHDNTPSVLPNGQILYMRWEYVDRSQVEFHHLWTMNPDGTNQAIYYGNEVSWGVFLSCRPVPNTQQVMGIYSPGHGVNDQYGYLSFFSDRFGPDDPRGLKHIESPWGRGFLGDPWPLSADTILAVERHWLRERPESGEQYRARLVVISRNQNDDKYTPRALYEIKDNQQQWIVQSPHPILRRPREWVMAQHSRTPSPTGAQIAVQPYHGPAARGLAYYPGSGRGGGTGLPARRATGLWIAHLSGQPAVYPRNGALRHSTGGHTTRGCGSL